MIGHAAYAIMHASDQRSIMADRSPTTISGESSEDQVVSLAARPLEVVEIRAEATMTSQELNRGVRLVQNGSCPDDFSLCCCVTRTADTPPLHCRSRDAEGGPVPSGPLGQCRSGSGLLSMIQRGMIFLRSILIGDLLTPFRFPEEEPLTRGENRAGSENIGGQDVEQSQAFVEFARDF